MELNVMLEPALDTSLMTCLWCGEEKRIWVHAQKARRLHRGVCKRMFVETQGSPLFRLHYPHWLVIVVVSLLAHGCPVQAIVFAFGLDERTVSGWHERAGAMRDVYRKSWCTREIMERKEMFGKLKYL